jgi:hypothetical protein
MNKPALFFAGTTGLFALSTLYFARELHRRDDSAVVDTGIVRPSESATPAIAPTTPVPASPAPTGRPALDVAMQAASTTPSTPIAGDDSRRGILLPFARDYLRQYDDLALRGALLASARTGFESQYAALKDRLKLDRSTFDDLVTLLAEESMEQQAGYFRCVADPACDPGKVAMPRDRSDEYLALLGATNQAEFNSYRDALSEWQSVIQLRGRLSETNYLRDGDAEQLRKALTDARQRYATQTRQQGADLRGWGDGTGMLWYTGDGTPQQQLASATQYSQMLRQQAATLLNAEQLRAFGQIQDQLLASFAAYLQQAQSKP